MEQEHTTGCSEDQTADAFTGCLKDFLRNKIKGLGDGRFAFSVKAEESFLTYFSSVLDSRDGLHNRRREG